MKKGTKTGLFILGLVVCVLSVVFGLWMGLYVCLYGGVVSIITGFAADPWIVGMIAWGVVKFLCTGVVGWLSFAFGFGSGTFIIAMSE